MLLLWVFLEERWSHFYRRRRILLLLKMTELQRDHRGHFVNGSRSRQIFPSPFFLSSHWLQGKVTFSWLVRFVMSTFSNIQPAPKPLLSCSIRKRVSWPRSSASILKSSTFPLSNKLTNFLVSCLCPVSPFAPYKRMETLASVPACATSAVKTSIRYWTGWRSKTREEKIKMR